MRVYIEFVIIDNLAIDSVIVYLSLLSAKLKARWYLVLASAALGTVTAVLMPYLAPLGNAVALAVKIAASFLICLAAAKYPSFKKYLLTVGLFYVYTFLIGGISMGAMYLLGADTVSFVTLTYHYKIPVGILVGGVFLGYLTARFVLEYIKKRRAVDRWLVRVTIFYGGQSVDTVGFLDSGNRLFDDVTGFPVVIAHRRIVNKLLGLPQGATEYPKLNKMHTTMYHTVAMCNNSLLLFKPDKLLYYLGTSVHTIEDVMIGISDNDVSFGEDYSVLLNGSLPL